MTVPQSRKTLLIISKGQSPSLKQLYTNGQEEIKKNKNKQGPVENSGPAGKDTDQTRRVSSRAAVFPGFDLDLTFRTKEEKSFNLCFFCM